MKKKESKKNIIKNKFINILYALILEFVFVPILGFFTYYVYDKVAFLGSVQDSMALFIVIIVLIVLINIILLYGLAYLFNVVYKFDFIYYIVVGLITSATCLWIKVYYFTVERAECLVADSINCLEANHNNHLFTVILVFVIAYYLLYLTVHKMVQKKIELSKKEQ